MFTIKVIRTQETTCYEQLFSALDGIHILMPGDATYETLVSEDKYYTTKGDDCGVRSVICYNDPDKRERYIFLEKGVNAYIINDAGQTVSRA